MFIDNTNFLYNSKICIQKNLRAETVLINLSNSLVKLGHKITIINNCPKSENINGIKWLNINSSFEINDYDLAFANADCRLFNLVKSKKILFSHSTKFEKFIRKKQLFAYLKHKPVCFLSEYHLKKRSKLLYLFGNINLRYAVDDIFKYQSK